MGWKPDEIRKCSLNDFAAAFEGWQAAHGGPRNWKDQVDYSPEAIAELEAEDHAERVYQWRRKSQH